MKFQDLTPDKKLLWHLDIAYKRVMASGRYINGAEVEAFEQEWADYNGAQYCVSCGSGLDALQLVLRAINDDEHYKHESVSVTNFTASSTWSAIEAAGMRPWPQEYRYPIKIIVHLYGQLNQEKVNPKTQYLIQDCAQAHGLKITHKETLSYACCWSFYPTKNLGAYGDGGAITTNDEELTDKLRLLRNYGCNNAINSRLDPLQAAFLRVKLPYLDIWNKQRQEFAAYYLEQLSDIPGLTLPEAKPDEAVWHQFVIRHKNRNGLKTHLAQNGIEAMVHYPVPPHRALGYNYDLSEADEMAMTVLSLPIAPHLTMDDIKTVVKEINGFFNH